MNKSSQNVSRQEIKCMY